MVDAASTPSTGCSASAAPTNIIAVPMRRR
jgi:hypothetical protein